MLTNATITRIDTQGATSADGRHLLVEGGSIAVRCLIDAVSSRHRYTLGATIEDADRVAYIPRTAGLTVNPGYRLLIQADNQAEASASIVVTLGDRLGPGGGGLSHLEVFMRRDTGGTL